MLEDKTEVVKPVISHRLLVGLIVCWAILFLFGFSSIYRYAQIEQERDQQQWQRQVQLTAESQRRQVSGWVTAQQSVVKGLANNTSLKLYLTELNQSPADGVDVAFTSFLTNLLISEAQQHKFYEANALDKLPANVSVTRGAGLAIVDTRGVPIVATQGINSTFLQTIDNKTVKPAYD